MRPTAGLPSPRALLILLLALLVIDGCSENPAGPAPTPQLDLGSAVPVASQMVGPGGGTVVVDAPGDSLDGLTIAIPDGAYRDGRTYQIESRKIAGIRNGRETFKPITPLITIRNGGGFAEAPITLTIPCTVPEGEFPMAFLYDPATGSLEGMPLAGYDAHSVTVLTANFEHSAAMAAAKINASGPNGAGAAQEDAESNIVVSSISERLLESYREVGSTFKPGNDDWQFVNWGSYASPDGQCAGQTLGALWYFMQRKSRGDAKLNGRFDNDGEAELTPKVWQDDMSAYRFCAVLQAEYWESAAARILGKVQWLLPDQLTYNAIKYAMIITGEPVYITAGGTLNGNPIRHALTVYRIADHTLYIADPNNPGDLNRTIQLSGLSFTPYMFGTNGATFPGVPFPEIEYIAKSSVIDYKRIKGYYDQLLDGTIGADLFPQYTIEVKNDGGYFIPLTDGYRTGKRFLTLQVTSPDLLFVPGFEVYREDGTLYTRSIDDISLPVGRHRIGVYVYDKNKGRQGYVGFRWFTVEVWETPPVHEPKNNGPCTCTLSLDGASVSVASASFTQSAYQHPITSQLEQDFTIYAHYNGGYAIVEIQQFKGAGTYPLYTTVGNGGTEIVDTNGGPGRGHSWSPYNGTNVMNIKEWDDWHAKGDFEITYDNDLTGEKRKAIGTFTCGR